MRLSEELIREVEVADFLVIGTPMNNFTVPSVLWTAKSPGRMAKIAKKTKRYPSDLTDEEWSAGGAVAAKGGADGSPRRIDLREVLNAIRDLVRSGWPPAHAQSPRPTLPIARQSRRFSTRSTRAGAGSGIFSQIAAYDRRQLLDKANFLGFTLEIVKQTQAAFVALHGDGWSREHSDR
jgi:hypothetical protein